MRGFSRLGEKKIDRELKFNKFRAPSTPDLSRLNAVQTWSSAQSRRRTRCHARGFNSHADPRTPYEPPRRVLHFYRTVFFPDEPPMNAARIRRARHAGGQSDS